MAGLATIGVKFKYKTSGETYTELPNLLEVPEMGGNPEKIDVTCLTDESKKYINGVKDYGDLAFTFLYDADEENSSYTALRNLEGTETEYQVEFPDGATFTFSAIVSVKTGSIAVNDAIKFTASFSLQSEVITQ